MSYRILTLSESAAQNLAFLEGSLAQTVPLQEKAFLRVLAVMQALGHTGLMKYAAYQALQNLALTAKKKDLDRIGAEFSVVRKPAEAAIISVDITGVDGKTIPAGWLFSGASNGVLYAVDSSVIIAGGTANFSATAATPGVLGNLNSTDILNIVTPIAGVATTAIVDSLTNTGTEEETDDAYRLRVLAAQRLTTGGGNNADYKVWAEGVGGVYRAFPYSGKPDSLMLPSYPMDRSVFIEATVQVDPDGIAPPALLAEVRDAINFDPVTGKQRAGLGAVDSILWVESITRTSMDVEINGLVTPSGQEASVKADIEAASAIYFLLVAPYITGITLPQERNETVTNLTVSLVVQEILNDRGSSATGVQFKLSSGGGFLPSYTVSQGELLKLGVITYV